MQALTCSLLLSFVATLLGAALPVVASAQSRTVALEAGPIWSQADAQTKCAAVAKANDGTWNGQWRTTVPGKMSICEVRLGRSSGRYAVESIEAGPIWNQTDAEKKCPQVANTNGGTWNGQWKTTVPGKMSVCEVRLPLPRS